MDIEEGTRIGADGKRHPAGQEPTDAAEYNRRLVRVQGALEDDKVPVWNDDEESWELGEGGGFPSEDDLDPADRTGDGDFATIYQDGELKKIPVSSQTAPARPGGIPLQPRVFRDVGDKWLRAGEGPPVKIVILGDSLVGAAGQSVSLSSTCSRALNLATVGTRVDSSWLTPNDANHFTSTGTLTTACTGGGGVVLNAGQKITSVKSFEYNAVSIMYKSEASSGVLTIRRGVAGATAGSIAVNGSAGYGSIYTTPALTPATTVLEIENTGSNPVTIERVMVHNNNRTSGAHVWDIARSGVIGTFYTENTDRWKPFVEKYQPDFVVVELGTNGLGNFENLLGQIKAAVPDSILVGAVCYKNSAYTWDEIEEQREICNRVCDITVDYASIFGDGAPLTGDGVHPLVEFSTALGKVLAAHLSGDPINSMAYIEPLGSFSTSQLQIGEGTSSSIVRGDGTGNLVIGSALSWFFADPKATLGVSGVVIREDTAPAAPPAGKAILYATTAGLYVRFPTGDPVQLAAKP